MLVYRVERRSDGAGPYQWDEVTGGCPARNGWEFDCNVYEHPGPFDGRERGTDLWKGDWPDDALFGFTSLRTARRWWYRSGFRKWLDRQGFCLAVYMVPKWSVWKGNHQCVFDPANAERVERRDVASLASA